MGGPLVTRLRGGERAVALASLPFCSPPLTALQDEISPRVVEQPEGRARVPFRVLLSPAESQVK